MSDYHLVSTLHAARVTLADVRKAGDRAAVAAADSEVASARAAVNAALATGRVTSSKHLLDLDLDCLGAILSHLGPNDAVRAAHTCTTLRSALFRGGLPVPLAFACRKWWSRLNDADIEAALRALDGMDPHLGAMRLKFRVDMYKNGCARVLARALDAAPRAARIDVTFPGLLNVHDANPIGRLADILSSPDRAFETAPQVHVTGILSRQADLLLPLTRAGLCVASIDQSFFDNRGANFIERVAAHAASTLTQLYVRLPGTLNLPTRFPVLRRLKLSIRYAWMFTADVPSLTALAPNLKEIDFGYIGDGSNPIRPSRHGFGFEPRRFARFVAAIHGVTRICFSHLVMATLRQNENENLGQLTALRTLRDLEIASFVCTFAPAPVAEDLVTNLPPLAPGLTRLALSSTTRVAFGHPLPGLRVLDWRASWPKVSCGSTFFKDSFPQWHVPLAVPPATLAPNLHTLLIGYAYWKPRGDFDLWTLVAAPTALRVVVIEHARLFCSAPGRTTTTAFAALLARDAKDMLSVHTHGCEIDGAHQPAAENFLRAVEQRGGRVCRAGVEECLFCMLHDGTDLWPPVIRPRWG